MEAERVAAEKAAADKIAADKAAAEAKAAEETRLATERKARIDAALQTLDGLDGRLGKGVLSECGDIAKVLGAFTPEALGDENVKKRWEAAKAGYTKLVAQTLLQKDPLAQRAQRLKGVEDVLGQAEAAALFGEGAATLRRALDQQTEICLLRLINKGLSTVEVSAKELPEKTALTAGEAKEWQIPVQDKTLAVSIKVEGGNMSSAQSMTVYLPRSGGIEQAVRALEPEAAKKPAEPQKVTPPPVVAETAPKTDVKAPQAETPAQKTAAPAGSQAAAIEITLSPKTAQVTVDDQPAQAGRMEVTPNENHKVTVVCQGYKPVQQYYKVRPGETRKIDILLEKEIKKSFFGF